MRIWKVLLVALPIALPAMAGQAWAQWVCGDYANFALRETRKAVALNCGFSGPRWSDDEGLHFGYCIEMKKIADENALTNETNIRKDELAACETKAAAQNNCTQYGRTAIAAVNDAAQVGCGFDGPRWSADEGLHFGYCTERSNAGDSFAIANETAIRSTELSQCKLAKANTAPVVKGPDPVVPVVAPPPPAATATANQTTAYYDAPGGNGNYLGDVNLDQKVAIVECRADDWCQISGPDGWVWGPHLNR